MGEQPIETQDVAQRVEWYVDGELRDAEKYTNRTPLDDSGVYSLHRLAAEVYALGWREGFRAADEHARGRRQRHPRATPAGTDSADGAESER